MFPIIYLTFGALILIGLYLVLRAGVGAYRDFSGERLITCPETKTTEAVEVNARHAAFTALTGEPDLRLKDCTRWPGRGGCGQECLRQIEAAPMECLVRNRLAGWYEGKSCAVCQKKFDDIRWFDHKPGLLAPDQTIAEWFELRPEKLPEILATHQPLCWDCVVAETFRTRHPEMVVDRPAWKGGLPRRF